LEPSLFKKPFTWEKDYLKDPLYLKYRLLYLKDVLLYLKDLPFTW